MHLPIEHISSSWNDDQMYGVDQLGIRVLYGTAPSPLKVPSTFPGNTHAIIRLRFMKVQLSTDCYTDENAPHLVNQDYYSPDECMKDAFMDAARAYCDCDIIIADVAPRNDKVCDPVRVKDCVQRKVLASGIGDVANQTLVRIWLIQGVLKSQDF